MTGYERYERYVTPGSATAALAGLHAAHHRMATLCKNSAAVSHVPDVVTGVAICTYAKITGADPLAQACAAAPGLDLRDCRDVMCVLAKVEACAKDSKCFEQVKQVAEAANATSMVVPKDKNFGASALALALASAEVNYMVASTLRTACMSVETRK